MAKASEPIMIGRKLCKNRLTMAPTVKFAAGDDGLVTDEFVRHYESRAAGEVGLIVVEATCVAKEARLHPKQLGLWEDHQIEGHQRITTAVHQHGALIIPQLHHGGLSTHPECGPMTSPTRVRWNNGFFEGWATELSHKDIQTVIMQFLDAAIRAKKAGYDGVQLHGCHGYLINDFASNVNQRTDEYGGSVENKSRLGCEIIKRIREACGEDFIISVRISGADPSVAEARQVAKYYVEAGCDYLQVSCGIAEFDDVPYEENAPYNKIAALGVEMHKHFRGIVPVSTVNGFRNVEITRFMLENDLVDTVDLGCGLLADPRFAAAILHDTEYIKCFNCPNCAFGPDHKHPCPAMHLRGEREFEVIPV